ncbi:MAG: MCE family protein [Methylocystis sp.]|nr:MCE family protein [Methylocystis sp.]MBI3275510.1 MCE family protein [Methylocystis sp.]
METRASYTLIGVFTVAVVFAAFGFVYWFSGPAQTAQYKTYEIVFPGSVAGLARGSAVEFNGLKVGEVTHLAISAEDPSLVDVLISIDKHTPVKADTTARLEQKGLTGVPALSLTGGTPGAPELQVEPGQRFPRILAERSDIQNLLASLQRFSNKASDVFEKLDKVLDANSAALAATLKNTEAFSARLDKLLAAVEPKKITSITNDVAGASTNINRFSGSGLRQYEQLAVDARKAVDALDRAVRSLERDPQQVIFGATPAIPEYRGR